MRPSATQWGKDGLFNTCSEAIGYSFEKKKDLDSYLTLKINLRWFIL